MNRNNTNEDFDVGSVIYFLLCIPIFWGLVYIGFVLCSYVFHGAKELWNESIELEKQFISGKSDFKALSQDDDDFTRKLNRRRKRQHLAVLVYILIGATIILLILIDGLYRYGTIFFWWIMDFLGWVLRVE